MFDTGAGSFFHNDNLDTPILLPYLFQQIKRASKFTKIENCSNKWKKVVFLSLFFQFSLENF